MTDFEKELKDALVRKETLRDEYMKNEGVISFLQYAIKNAEEKTKETVSVQS